jgi:putative alpha-1,2-mannosidase
MGGKEKMASRLDQMMGLPPTFHVGEYGNVIHEMSEMAAVNFGQYAHGNQPVHHVLYLYAALGQPHKTQYWTRRVCQELYHSGPDGFAGDEDNGEMSSWFVLSSLGLFQPCVGDPSYTLTSPLFDRADLQLPGGRRLTILGDSNGPKNVYVQSRMLDDKSLNGEAVAYERLMQGGTLKVKLGVMPPETAQAPR